MMTDKQRISAKALSELLDQFKEKLAAKDAEIARLKQAAERHNLYMGCKQLMGTHGGMHWDIEERLQRIDSLQRELAAARQQLQEAQADAEQAVRVGIEWMEKAARYKDDAERMDWLGAHIPNYYVMVGTIFHCYVTRPIRAAIDDALKGTDDNRKP